MLKTDSKYILQKSLEMCTSRGLYLFKALFNYTLISTSTPLGNSNFIKASTVLDEDE